MLEALLGGKACRCASKASLQFVNFGQVTTSDVRDLRDSVTLMSSRPSIALVASLDP